MQEVQVAFEAKVSIAYHEASNSTCTANGEGTARNMDVI